MKGFSFAAALLALLSIPTGVAHAGGYDTPMLYSARHIGMGGTAVANVNDPSALFHNPAGLAGTRKLTLMGDFSLLVGNIDAAPDQDAGTLTSNTTVGPFFLLGASGRITDWLTAGFAVYPVASAGATFEYERGPRNITDTTRLVFIEMSPGVAFEIPQINLSLGFGYRITLVQLERQRFEPGEPYNPGEQDVDFALSGTNFKGLRFGLQWAPFVRGEGGSNFGLQFGAHYRHKTRTTVDGMGVALSDEPVDISTAFTLPSRLSFGVRGDYDLFGAAVDIEYALNSQNDGEAIVAAGIPVPNVFRWDDALTVRVGLEARLLDEHIPIRVGYVWDQQTANPIYPTAFGTPPAATHVITFGAGYETGPLSVNFAFAHRRGGTTFTQDQFDSRPDSCSFCGFPGDYFIRLNGIYLDVSYAFGNGEIGDSPAEVRRARYDQPDCGGGGCGGGPTDVDAEGWEDGGAATTESTESEAQPAVAVAASVEADPDDVHIVGDHLTIDRHIHFAHDSDEILEDSFELIDHIALLLSHHPEIAHIKIIGHTDVAGGHAHNVELSNRRAAAVEQALRARGVTIELEHDGVGESEPVCEEDTDECHARNRRVEFLILPPTAAATP